MRLRTWELPMNVVGEVTETPFVVVVDRVPENQAELVRQVAEGVKDSTGARAVLVFADNVGDVELGESA